MKARDFIQDGESVVVIFTRGDRLEINEDHSGSTGNWSINPHRKVHRVVIYRRDELTEKNSIFLATFEGAILSEDEDRYNIQLSHIQYAGETNLHWGEFADTGSQPVRYLP